MVPFFTLLLLIIVAVTIFVTLIKNSNEAKQTEEAGVQVTIVPTVAATPTLVPTPTVIPENVSKLYPVPQTVDDQTKYGYIDKTGTFVIPPSFDMASDFNDGAAVVSLDSKNCVIDESGNLLFINDAMVYDFSNGLAMYAYSDNVDAPLYGYVDTKGNIVIEPQYSLATNFMEDGTAYVSTGAGNYSLIDKTGKVLETYTLDDKYSSAWTLQDGYVIYAASDYANYGVVNVKGEEILPSGFSEITYLGNDLFAVKEPGLETGDKIMSAKEAIFNAKGEQLTDYSLYDLSSFYHGYGSATDDTSTFFVGTDGKAADNLPKFDGIGTVKLLGDVISATIDGELMYCNTDESIIWRAPDSVELSDGIKVNSLKYRPMRDVLVRYPEIDGMADTTLQNQINAQLYNLFVTVRKDITPEDYLVVDDSFSAKLIKHLLIVERTGYDYYYGAAHGMPIMDYYYIDMTTGVSYQLKDLFLEGSDYAAKINQMITDEMNADIESGESMYFPETFTGITDTQYFMLDEDALTVYFYPYDIAAYAAGFPQFVIPFTDIDEFINKEGAFWKAFHQ
jgi:hypothetical protein